MNNNGEIFQIVHIPDKPPVPPNQQPTVDVFAAMIEPKLANVLVRRLNQIAPLEDLRHVKRIQKKNLEGGKIQLTVILYLACENENQLIKVPQDVQELIDSYKLSPFITKVCKYAASSKEEWEEQCKLWPTSYHPPTFNIDGITGFSNEESQSIYSFMRFAIELASSGSVVLVNAAVIVDPSVKQIIASATDQIYSWHAPARKLSNETSYFRQSETSASDANSVGVASNTTDIFLNGPTDKPKQLYTTVSCLNPWLWAGEQTHTTNSCYCHPLRHAAIIAIESSASRDRQLFPGSAHNGEEFYEVDAQSSSMGSAKRQETNLTIVQNDAGQDAQAEVFHSLSTRPYLCTGYDIYLVWEPCTMCAMALLHQRIRRIFYAFPNPNAGALGSVHRLHGEKSLNHHYAVFRVVLPDKVLNTTRLASSTDNDENPDDNRTAMSRT